jgi:hypothetical protein
LGRAVETRLLGIVDDLVAPELVRNDHARPGELMYWVRFDEPEFDHADDGRIARPSALVVGGEKPHPGRDPHRHRCTAEGVVAVAVTPG